MTIGFMRNAFLGAASYISVTSWDGGATMPHAQAYSKCDTAQSLDQAGTINGRHKTEFGGHKLTEWWC